MAIVNTGLTKRYGPKQVVTDLSFSVEPGRVTGFLGPNGSGKSTTMRMMLGVHRPTSGQTRFDGQKYADIQYPGRVVGAMLDARSVDGSRTARNHLLWVAACARISDQRVDEALDLVGLTGVAERTVGGFSLGMHQRLGIAAALVGDPQYLILDEPTNGLDPEGIHWMRDFFRRCAAEGRSILVSSHLLSELELYVDDLVVIAAGQLISAGTLAQFTTQAGAAETVRVNSPTLEQLRQVLASRQLQVIDQDGALLVSGASAAIIGDIAAANGITIHELTTLRESLEEAFLRITSGRAEYQSGPTDGAAS
jgi:ABC-2 type transport system ATP-binding protein